jgi:MFS family permease
VLLVTAPTVRAGLLSWPAWQTLAGASRVLAPAADHPLLPALDEAGIGWEVLPGAGPDDPELLTRAVQGEPGTVVWLWPPDPPGRPPGVTPGPLALAGALGLLAASGGMVDVAAVAAVALGLGTALVYPTLIAAISDAVTPVARAPVVGVYRFWRDMGYVAGGLVAGILADAIEFGGAIAVVAVLTAVSGLWVALDMPGSTAARPAVIPQEESS